MEVEIEVRKMPAKSQLIPLELFVSTVSSELYKLVVDFTIQVLNCGATILMS